MWVMNRAMPLLAFAVFIWLVSTLVQAAAPAQTEKRVALVIGNSAYQHTTPLRNPANDASDLAAMLRARGFQVALKRNLTSGQFDATLADFEDSAQGADVALFYFAGHGVQYNGDNYLIPVDAKLRRLYSIQREAIRTDQIVQVLENSARLNLVFLDACRNNPLAARLKQSLTSRGRRTRAVSLSRGLGRIEGAQGETLIVYAAAPGTVSFDGDGRNGPFVTALIDAVKETPEAEIESLLKRVRRKVKQATARIAQTAGLPVQRPEWLSRLESDFRFGDARKDNGRQRRVSKPTAEARAKVSLLVSEPPPSGSDAADGNVKSTQELYEEGKREFIAQNYKKALQLFRAARAQGSFEAVSAIGWIYQNGLGVRKNYARAKRLYEQAAAAGSAAAMYNLGAIYATGKGVTQSDRRAAHWFKEAVDRGHSGAMVDLGTLYLNGRGVKLNTRKALELFKRAKNLGQVHAGTKIAVMYIQGTGVKQNIAKAIGLLRVAADQSDGKAMLTLGTFYDQGIGVKRNWRLALKWVAKALASGDKEAIKLFKATAGGYSAKLRRGLKRALDRELKRRNRW